MPRITPLKFREVCNKLRKLGFEGPMAGGKHPLMVKNGRVVPVPHHGGDDVSKGVIEAIINRLQVDKEEWINL